MRPITADDLQEFWDSGTDYLAADLAAADDFLLHLDTEAFSGHPVAYDHAETEDGREVLILCDRTALDSGEWFPDLLDEDGVPRPNVLAAAAENITSDGLLEAALRNASTAAEEWAQRTLAADEAALHRARAVAHIVDLVGGSQSEAARLLGINQSRVNRLVKKSRQ